MHNAFSLKTHFFHVNTFRTNTLKLITTHTQILKSKLTRKFKISTVLIISLERGATYCD